MMKWVLIGLCLIVLVSMTCVTVAASLDQNVADAARQLWPDLWFRATLMDAYFAFLTFFVWVAYKESDWIKCAAWLAAILCLGNFAMSAYLLMQLTKMKQFSWEALLLRNPLAPEQP